MTPGAERGGLCSLWAVGASTIARRISDDLLRYPAPKRTIQSAAMGAVRFASGPALCMARRTIDAGEWWLRTWWLRTWRVRTWAGRVWPAIRPIWWSAIDRCLRAHRRMGRATAATSMGRPTAATPVGATVGATAVGRPATAPAFATGR